MAGYRQILITVPCRREVVRAVTTEVLPPENLPIILLRHCSVMYATGPTTGCPLISSTARGRIQVIIAATRHVTPVIWVIAKSCSGHHRPTSRTVPAVMQVTIERVKMTIGA